MENFNKVRRSLGELVSEKKVRQSHAKIKKFEQGEVLVSYSTAVAIRSRGKIFLNSKYDCSRTTTIHTSEFVGLPISEVRKRIKAGEIELLPVE